MIQQQHIGQVTVVGECFAFGCAVDGQQLIYLDIAGSATSVEAVWARLVQGKEVAIIPPEKAAAKIPLQSAEGQLKRLQRKVEGIGIYHQVLIHHAIVEPAYSERSTTYLFLTADKAQTTAKLGAHISELVDSAVFPAWHSFLVQQGRLANLLKPLTCYGGVQLWRLMLDKIVWQQLISRGLQHQTVNFNVTAK